MEHNGGRTERISGTGHSGSGRLIIGLDIGTSSCKAVLFNEYGYELALGRGHYPIQYDKLKGLAEQKPDFIWQGVCDAVNHLLLSCPDAAQAQAISISSQISSHFIIDKNNKPLTDIITWMDSRADEEAGEMRRAFSREELYQLLGADLPTSPSWPIPKLRWMSKHIPNLLALTKYLIQPKEWVVWKLTSEWRSDLSSLRGVVNQKSGMPVEPLLAWAGASKAIIPPHGNPYDIAGPLLPEAANRLGLHIGIPVILGWNDFNAAILGSVGVNNGNGQGFDITGTSEHIGIVHTQSKPIASYEGINQIPMWNGNELFYGVTSSGGQAFQWYATRIDQLRMDEAADYESVTQQAENIAAGSEGVICLPFLNGERAPWWNPSARGVFFGLHATHHRGHMARALLEGVGYALRTIIERLPVAPREIIISGGASRNPLWNQIKADIIGMPFHRLETTESGCLGAAILAAYGLGWHSSLDETCRQMIRTSQTFYPNLHNREAYQEGYEIYNDLYKSLIPIYDKAVKSNKLRRLV